MNIYRMALLAGLLMLPRIVMAEISTDSTLGPAMSLGGPDFAITSDLGQLVGSNLFHSFRIFNINTGETATFSGPASVTNILGRVTGGSASSIDGAINSNITGANLYLINPAGVIFGENASLNVSGSFHVTTADYLVLSDGGRFDATTPGNSVLTSAPPSAFGFLGAPADISIQGAYLTVPSNETLTITGGDISLANALLHAPEGNIGIASLASAGELSTDINNFSTDNFNTLGDITLTHVGDVFSRFVFGVGLVGNIDTSGESGGTIVIRSGKFVVDRALVFADTSNGSGALIDVDVRNEVRLSSGSTLSADVVGDGQGGVVKVKTASLILESGGRLQAISVGPGVAGNIQVDASDSVSIEGVSDASLPLLGDQNSGLFGFVTDAGNGGTISVNTADLQIGAGGQILVDTGSGSANGGAIIIDAGSVLIKDGGLVQADTQGGGNAGTINLNVDTLEISGGGSVSSKSLGSGAGGEISVNATDSVTLTGTGEAGPSGIFSNAFSSGDGGTVTIAATDLSLNNEAKIQAGVGESSEVGGLPPATADTRAGAINIRVDELTITGKAQISTQSENAGLAGNVTITADSLMIDSPAGEVQSGVFSTAADSGTGGNIQITGGRLTINGGAINVSSNSSGNAGQVDVSVDQLNMTGGAQISTASDGSGDAGALNVAASGDVSISGEDTGGFQTGLYSLAQGSGKGGDIQLSAASVTLSNNGLITAESSGSGDAGNIKVTAIDAVTLNDSSITTQAVTADGGNIKVTADRLVYLLDSRITTSVGQGFGDGGNINIDPEFVVLNNSQILANAFGGDGGNITIVADHFVSSNNSVLDASSELGIDGTIEIISPDEEIKNRVEELPVDYLDATALLRERCNAKHLTDQSSFTLGGRKGVPVSPNGAAALSSLLSDSLPGRPQPLAVHSTTEPNALRVNHLQGSQMLGSLLGARGWGCTL